MALQVASLFATIGADLSGLNRGLEQARNKIQAAKQTMQTLADGAKQLQDRLNEVGKHAQNAGIALGGMAAAGGMLLRTLGMTASRTEELGVAMMVVGKNMGYTNAQLLRSVDTIKELGITTQVAQTMVTRFAQLELDMADAAKIARAAQDMAVIGMEDSSTAAERMTTAIARQWPILLRQYGIYKGLEQVYEDHAKTLRKNADDLTELEKRQAFVNLILEEAAKYSGVYTAAMESASKKIRTLQRYTQELANAYGQYLLPVMGRLVDAFTALLKWLTDLPEGAKKAIVYAVGLGTALTGIAAGATLAIAGIAKITSALLSLPRLLASIITLFAGKTKALQAQTVAEDAAAASAVTLKGALLGLAAPITLIATALIAVSSQSRTLQSDLAAQEKAIRETAGTYNGYRWRVELAYEELVRFYREAGVAVDEIELMDRGLVLSQQEWDTWKVKTNEAVAALPVIMKAFPVLREELRSTMDALREAGIGWDDFRYAIQQVGDEMLGMSQLQWDIAQEHLKFEQQIAELAAEAAQERAKAAKEVARAEEEAAARITAAQSMIAQSYSQLASTIAGYNQQILAASEQYAWDRQMAELNALLSTQEAYAQHYQNLANAEAQYQASLLELQRRGKMEEIAELQAAHQEELAKINWRFETAQSQAAYAYEKQEALAKLHYAREKYLQAVANKAQIEDQIAHFKTETTIWLQQHEALFEGYAGFYQALLRLIGSYHKQVLTVEGAAAKAHAALEEAKAKASKEGAGAVARAIFNVIIAYEAALLAAQGAIDTAKGQIAEAIQGIKSIKIDLPAAPDWSAFVPDFAPEFKKISDNAKKATKDVTRSVADFANMITTAIDALIKLAGFEAPLRIQEGARQLEDALVSLIPMLGRLKGALDEAISVEGLQKIQQFAETLKSLIETAEKLAVVPISLGSMTEDSIDQLDKFMRDFTQWFDVFERFVWGKKKEYPDLGLIRPPSLDITKGDVERMTWWGDMMSSFGAGIQALVEATTALAALEKTEVFSPDWAERVFGGFMEGWVAMVDKMAELTTPDFRQKLYTVTALADSMEKVGRSVQSILGAMLAIESYWRIPDFSAMIARFVGDVRTLLGGLAGLQLPAPALAAGGAAGAGRLLVVAPVILDPRLFTTAGGGYDYQAMGRFLMQYEEAGWWQ